MVVGAGRGPLVRRALAAAKAGHRKIKIYAVEKNPNAVVTLQAQQDEDWGDQVGFWFCFSSNFSFWLFFSPYLFPTKLMFVLCSL